MRAAGLRAALRISASTLQRAVRAERDRLVVAGRARATTYAARRDVQGVRTPLEVYEIGEAGEPRHALTLHPVEPFGHYVEGHVPEVADGFHEADPTDLAPGLDLPWFLQDAMPSGYLGRSWLRAHPDQGYPVDLARWTGDDVLRYAAHHGTDLVGAFVVGAYARDELLDRPTTDVGVMEPDVLVQGARQVVAGEPVGSSPGGEQPKFTLRTTRGSHIVKFSPPVDTPAGLRWADLLAAEHMAHAVLRDHGVEAARSELVDHGGRRFLVVDRFDRVGPHGRRGVVSLLPFDREGVASALRRWSVVAAALVDDGRLDAEAYATVEWLEAFGHLIANTDMHPGNLSLWLNGTTITGLAPVYDMLPMFHAPRHGGELHEGLYEPRTERSAFPASAMEAARQLWQGVVESPHVSDGFRPLAEGQLALLTAS